ncbi:WD40-repeat-containing domain protein [Entophlyctis helioformis]|nr:WD40-repeat-containing domain protein [Entophlyctis helioformis]
MSAGTSRHDPGVLMRLNKGDSSATVAPAQPSATNAARGCNTAADNASAAAVHVDSRAAAATLENASKPHGKTDGPMFMMRPPKSSNASGGNAELDGKGTVSSLPAKPFASDMNSHELGSNDTISGSGATPTPATTASSLGDLSHRNNTFPLRQHSLRRAQLPSLENGPASDVASHSFIDKLSSSRTLMSASRSSIDGGSGSGGAGTGAASMVDGRLPPMHEHPGSLPASAAQMDEASQSLLQRRSVQEAGLLLFGPQSLRIPLSVARQILSHLSPSTLANSSRISRLPGFEDLLPEDHAVYADSFKWRAIFVQHAIRRRNWAQGQHKRYVIEATASTDAITCFCFDAEQIVVGTREHRVDLFQIDSPLFWTLAPSQALVPSISFTNSHQSPIMCMALSPAAEGMLISADTSGELVFWNAFTGQKLSHLKNAHKGGVSCIHLVDSTHVVTAGFDRLIRLYKISTETTTDPQSHSRVSGTGKDGKAKQKVGKHSHSSPSRQVKSHVQAHQRKQPPPLPPKPASLQAQQTHHNNSHTSSSASDGRQPPQGDHQGEQQLTDADPANDPSQPPKSRFWRLGRGSRSKPPQEAQARQSTPPTSFATDTAGSTPPSSSSHDRIERDAKAQTARSMFGRRRKDKGPKTTTERSVTLVHEMKGHKGDIYCLALFDDNSRLASGSTDSAIKIWNTRGGQCITTLKGHTQAVTCLRASGRSLYSGSLDRTIRKWDLDSGSCLQVITGHTEWIKTIDLNRDYLISGGWEETVFVWSLETGALVHKIALNLGPILSLQCDASRIVVAVREPKVQHELQFWTFAARLVLLLAQSGFRPLSALTGNDALGRRATGEMAGSTTGTSSSASWPRRIPMDPASLLGSSVIGSMFSNASVASLASRRTSSSSSIASTSGINALLSVGRSVTLPSTQSPMTGEAPPSASSIPSFPAIHMHHQYTSA